MRRSTIRLTSCNLGKLVDLGLARTFVLGSDKWLGVRARDTWSDVAGEVSFSLSLLSGSLEEDGVLSLGVLESELIESDDLTTSGSNSLSSGLGDSESADSELGDLEESDVVPM